MEPNALYHLILLIVVVGFLCEQLLNYINHLQWAKPLPPALKDLYSEEQHAKAKAYHNSNYGFALITESVSFVFTILVFYFKGFAFLDAWIVVNITTHYILRSLCFFGIIGLVMGIAGLPAGIYHTFVLEERFGFNKTTVKTYISDKIKGLILGTIVGGGLLTLFILYYHYAGSLFWLYAWITMTVVMLLMVMFYTSWILPLFNKLKPLEQGDLREAIEKYCKKVDFTIKDLYVMDGSKRSAKANAFFSGLGSKKKIVLFDTLIEKHTTEELVAVLAHETGHYKKKHSLRTITSSVIQTGIMLFFLSLALNRPETSYALGASEHTLHMGLITFGIFYSPLSLFTGLLFNYLSRKHEFEADAYAAETYDGRYLISALKKLSTDNLSNLQPHPVYVFFYYSHPPLIQRIHNIEKHIKNPSYGA